MADHSTSELTLSLFTTPELIPLSNYTHWFTKYGKKANLRLMVV